MQFGSSRPRKIAKLRRAKKLENLEPRHLLAGLPIISEFSASNQNSIVDAFGVSSDWVEIFNAGDEVVDLQGFYLSDDPGNATKWAFPDSTPLEPGQYRVVFASGQNVADAAGNWHTNFRLNSAGEYIGLSDPNGIAISEFGSEDEDFPKQFSDTSFGFGQTQVSDALVTSSSIAHVLVPNSNDLGTSWTAGDFVPDAAWTTGRNGVGFDAAVESADGTILRLDFNDDDEGEAGDENTEPGWQSFQLSENGANYDGIQVSVSDIGGIPIDDRDRGAPTDNPPALTYDQIFDDFIFGRSQTDGSGIEVLLEGLSPGREYEITLWSFDTGSIGSRVSNWNEVANGIPIPIESNYSFSGSDAPSSDQDNTMSAVLRAASDGTLRIQGTRNGGTSFGVFLNGLQIATPNAVELVQTDIQSQMYQQHTSSYIRMPFSVAEGVSYDQLSLDMQYDSGFAAYLNGTEVARRNVPANLAFDSSAETERSLALTVQPESINLSTFVNLIRAGENVLAIHGLNSDANDDDFLMRANLTGTQLKASLPVYFANPTPGAVNLGETFLGFADDTRFSVDRGFFDSPFSLEITSNTPGGSLVYTTDGSKPTRENGTLVEATDSESIPIANVMVSTTSFVRAFAFKDRLISSNVDTQSYIFLDDVIRQDPLSAPDGPDYPRTWQADATGDYEIDQEVVAAWDDNNPDNTDFGIREALTSIPTMSIVMDHDDLWDTRNGIYRNSNSRGERWRRSGSVEYFDPNSGEEFQIDAGVQVHGGASRDNVRLKKHSFRLLFRDDFGPGKLNFPLYSDTENTEFNTLVLRAFFTDAFATRTVTDRYNPVESQYLRDVWMKDTQLAMGNLSAHNTYVHLYINGLYWGLYNPSERPDDAFLSEYLGGEREDWDIVKDFNETFAGNKTAWNEMFSLSRDLAGAVDPNAIYHQLRGHNADGSPNDELPAYLDMDNLIDFMILHLYTGVEDWPHHNWYAGRNRIDPDKGYKFFVWDQEISVDHRYRDRTEVGTAADHRNTPAELYHNLRRSSSEFRLRFADRLQKHLYNDGALTVEANRARYIERANQIEKAIIGESARWGDAREGERHRLDSGGPTVTIPVMTVDLWREERDRVLNEIFPREHELIVERFAAIGLTSPLFPPVFNQHGGIVSSDFEISLTAPQDPILVETPILPEFSPVTAHIPRNGSLDSTDGIAPPAWTLQTFDDSSWLQGQGGVGFEGRTGYESLLGIDLLSEDIPQAQSADVNGDGSPDAASLYTRFSFDVAADVDVNAVDRFTLKAKYDDGFIAYLNGTKIVEQNARDNAQWDSTASRSHEADASSFENFDATEMKSLLIPGQANVLAIHAFNRSLSSNDFVISAELSFGVFKEIGEAPVYYTTDGSDPRTPNGDINSTAKLFDGPFQLNETGPVRARAFTEGLWSAQASPTFNVNPAGFDSILISEINYNPAQPSADELAIVPSLKNDDFEFIELFNASDSQTISLAGMKIDNGVSFTFPDESLAPGEYAVVVRDLTAFQTRYESQARVVGQWNGGLANNGERIEFLDANGAELFAFSYDDGNGWPVRADGVGATLELATSVPSTDLTRASAWRGSSEFGGTPGGPGSGPLGVVINELVARTEAPAIDAIELFNTTSQAIDMSGWFLSDSRDQLLKYQIPDGTTIEAGGYLVFDESHFNPNPQSPGDSDFALDGSGNDDIWLVVANDNGITPNDVSTFVDDVHFGASVLGESFGRSPNGSGDLAPMSNVTLNNQNSAPRVGPLIISEINYNASNPTAAALAVYSALRSRDLEFVELHNPTGGEVDLTGWRLRGGVDFDFETQTLRADETLVVVPFNPENDDNDQRRDAFRAHYGLDDSVRLIGGYGGRLDDGGDRIVLQRAEQNGDESIFTMEDEVRFGDSAPWPIGPDGAGETLNRLSPTLHGNPSDSWIAATPTPGMVSFNLPNADFNNDGQTDIGDLDLLCTGVRGADQRFDVNGDGSVNQADIDQMVNGVLRTVIGDTNLDRVFNSTDLVRIFQQGEYEDAIDGNSTWSDGDWNCDGDFTTGDLVAAFQAGTYVAAAKELSAISSAINADRTEHDRL